MKGDGRARTLEGFPSTVPQGARCKVCEQEGVRATGCRVVGAAGRAHRNRPNVRARLWRVLGKDGTWKGSHGKGPVHGSIHRGWVRNVWVRCGCAAPPSGGGSQSEAPSGVGIAARTGKVQSQRDPGRVLTGPSRGAPGFSPSSRKTVEHATADQRPRLARAPQPVPPASPAAREGRGTGAGTVLDVPPTNPIKPPLRRCCTTQHRATTLPGMDVSRSGPLLPASSLPIPSFTLAKGGIRTRGKEPSPKRRIYYVGTYLPT